MDIVNGKTYRFINVYHDGYGLNIYGTKDTDIKGGQNAHYIPYLANVNQF